MKKEILLFDLDGTLTDPMVGITKSVQYALRYYGIMEEDPAKLVPFIGPPLMDSFQKYYGFSREQAREGVLVYREYFSTRGIFENKEIPGIREMLEVLCAHGKKLYVATSKPEVYAKKILEHFSMDHFFTFIGGADMGETRNSKAAVIAYVLEQAGLCTSGKGRAQVCFPKEDEQVEICYPKESERRDIRERILMVGDREHDILGAKENQLQSIGVLFGYGSRRELEEAGADQIAENVEDLTRILLMDWGD